MKTTTIKSVLLLTTMLVANVIFAANSDTIKYHFENWDNWTMFSSHRGSTAYFGNTIISGEERTVYFIIDTNGPFDGDLMVGVFDMNTSKIITWGSSIQKSIKGGWDGVWIPLKVDLPQGKYYLRLLARPKGATEWTLVMISEPDPSLGMTPENTPYYEGPELYIYDVIPFESKQPSLDYVYKRNSGTVHPFYLNKEYQTPYCMFNRLNEPLKGTIRLVHERNEIDDWGSWFDVVGEKEITIEANAWKTDSIPMMATTDRGVAERYCGMIRMYWKVQNSHQWVLITEKYNINGTANTGGWTSANFADVSIKPLPTSIEESVTEEIKIWMAGGELHLSNPDAIRQVDIIALTGETAAVVSVTSGSNPINLPKGIYVAKINTKEGNVFTQKIAVSN